MPTFPHHPHVLPLAPRPSCPKTFQCFLETRIPKFRRLLYQTLLPSPPAQSNAPHLSCKRHSNQKSPRHWIPSINGIHKTATKIFPKIHTHILVTSFIRLYVFHIDISKVYRIGTLLCRKRTKEVLYPTVSSHWRQACNRGGSRLPIVSTGG
jgi:hypothetical protein